jgi:glutamyl-tRNA synthetase
VADARVRTRFAPSPTGALHFGSVRTALFAWLTARHAGGDFILRIEDTDQERYIPGTEALIIETLSWLGLNWDEGPEVGGPHEPYIQSLRIATYRTHADELVAAGHAYWCTCTPARLAAMRDAQRARSEPTRYDRRCLGRQAEVAKERSEGMAAVVRLRMPDGITEWDDLVRGHVSFANSDIDDQVLLKSDGFPTYHLAQVVDDHLMGITQVVRAVEWLPSTPKHLITYAALGWDPPQFAHVPLVLGPDHSKLSKRHGAQTVAEFRELGYLAEAVVNFLAFLGWSPGTEEEIFTLAELRSRIAFDRLQASPAILDQQRLDYLNGVWIRRIPVDQLAERIKPFLPQATTDQLVPIAAMVQERIRRLDQIPGLVAFAFSEPTPDADFLRGNLSADQALGFLEGVPDRLAGEPSQMMDRLRELALHMGGGDPANDKKFVQAAMRVLRVATTGAEVTPPLPESIALIGKEEAERRIQRAIRVLAASGQTST